MADELTKEEQEVFEKRVQAMMRMAIAFKAFWNHPRRSDEEKKAVRAFAEQFVNMGNIY